MLAGLDHREQGGYERHRVEVVHAHGSIDALVYVATPSNPEWLGDAPLEQIAAQILASHGPSGANVEYLLRLHEALVEMGGGDDHVAALVEMVRSSYHGPRRRR